MPTAIEQTNPAANTTKYPSSATDICYRIETVKSLLSQLHSRSRATSAAAMSPAASAPTQLRRRRQAAAWIPDARLHLLHGPPLWPFRHHGIVQRHGAPCGGCGVPGVRMDDVHLEGVPAGLARSRCAEMPSASSSASRSSMPAGQRADSSQSQALKRHDGSWLGVII